MRKIKFRAISLITGKWVHGGYYNMDDCHKGHRKHVIVCDNDKGFGYQTNHEPVKFETIGQFTGLYDNTIWEELSEEEKRVFYNKNYSEDGKSIKYRNIDDVKHLWKGKEIYEGDIVKIDETEDVDVVNWSDGKEF